jgi:hypothetical protein
MATPERQTSGTDDSRRLIIIVAVIAAVAIAGLFYFLMRASSSRTSEPRLEGAIRPGSPDFDQFAPRIVLDEQEADQANRAIGDIVMHLRATARNFTGRALTGLEIKGSVVDHQGQPVKQATVVVLPNPQQAELEPNRTMPVVVRLEGMTEKDDRANIKMEVTAFKFKQ